jgi:hypothetical protein
VKGKRKKRTLIVDEGFWKEKEKNSPFLEEGRIFCFDFSNPYQPLKIKEGDCSVVGLIGVENGNFYGITTGKKSHFFLFHQKGMVVPLFTFHKNVFPRRGIVKGPENILYLAANEKKAGKIYAYSTEADLLSNWGQISQSKLKEFLTLPPKEYVFGVTYHLQLRTLIILTSSGKLLFSCGEKRWEESLSGPVSPALIADQENGIFFACERRIFYYALKNRKRKEIGFIPVEKGKRYLAEVSCFCRGEETEIYGGTTVDGIFFEITPERKVISYGRPTAYEQIEGLILGTHQRVYGISQNPGGVGKLFSFQLADKSMKVLGVVSGEVPVQSVAHEIGDMARGKGGEILIGEKGRLAHLYLYFPPCEGGER